MVGFLVMHYKVLGSSSGNAMMSCVHDACVSNNIKLKTINKPSCYMSNPTFRVYVCNIVV